MRSPISFSALLSLLLLTAACSPKYYAPNTQQIPAFHQKGDMAFSAAIGSDKRADIQAAYAASDWFAVQLNGGIFSKTEEEGTGDSGQGYLLEGGAGYYKPFADDKLVFETYLQAGFGHMNNNFPSTIAMYPATTGKIDANLLRIGLQPSLTFTTKYFDAAFSSRFALLQFTDIKGNLTFNDVDQVRYLNDEKGQFVSEPAITLRLGYDKFKVQFQLGWSINMTAANFKQSEGWSSLGLGYRF
jgi:hypothetical protein